MFAALALFHRYNTGLVPERGKRRCAAGGQGRFVLREGDFFQFPLRRGGLHDAQPRRKLAAQALSKAGRFRIGAEQHVQRLAQARYA